MHVREAGVGDGYLLYWGAYVTLNFRSLARHTFSCPTSRISPHVRPKVALANQSLRAAYARVGELVKLSERIMAEGSGEEGSWLSSGGLAPESGGVWGEAHFLQRERWHFDWKKSEGQSVRGKKTELLQRHDN